MKHVISAIVENQPGVLAHVAGMFAARGYNIDSLVVGRTEDPALSRMTIVVIGDEQVLEQVRKQLEKVINVVRVRDFMDADYIQRDMMLIRVHVTPEKRPEVLALVEMFRAKAVDICRNSMMVEIAGPEDKIEAFIDLVRPYGIHELARTGIIAMQRGKSKTGSETQNGKA
ncbi:MAG: acetolactate synthase small subunit [Phycisphaerae bacterium]|nr:acetolactate synthase small subunit [Phycisphaerae bacterium]